MKFITEPKVFLAGRLIVNQEAMAEFLNDHMVSWETDAGTAAEYLVESAGRICYMSFAKPRPGGNKAYIDHILEVGHGSVIEHAVWNIIVTGVSRSLSHELVRHRAGMSPSQLSQRYVDESETNMVVPPDYQEALEAWRHCIHRLCHQDPSTHYLTFRDGNCSKERYDDMVSLGGVWADAVSTSIDNYRRLAELAVKLWPNKERKELRQAARSVLPNATETKLFLTFNARALRHFIEMRASRFADVEIRQLAVKLYDLMVVEAPVLFGDYTKTELPDGTFEVTTTHRKV